MSKKTLGKEALCRVPEKKHSAIHLALGKEPVSGSESAVSAVLLIGKKTNKCGVSCVGAFEDWEFDAFFFTKIECVG